MEIIPLEIFHLIFEELDLKSKLQFQSTNHYLFNTLIITDLYHIEKKYLKRLTDKILRQAKYKKITKLNATNNQNIKKISHLTNLDTLNASNRCKHLCISIKKMLRNQSKKYPKIKFSKA